MVDSPLSTSSDSSSAVETTRHPFDPSVYELGDTLPIEVIEIGYGVTRDTQEFSFAAMNACAFIARYWQLEHGMIVTVHIAKGAVHICTHSEAVAYNISESRKALRRFAKGHRRLISADPAELTPDEIELQRRAVASTGAILAFAKGRPIPRLPR